VLEHKQLAEERTLRSMYLTLSSRFRVHCSFKQSESEATRVKQAYDKWSHDNEKLLKHIADCGSALAYSVP